MRCLESLGDHTKLNHDIFVLDNGSEDGTRDWLAGRRAPNLKIMLSPLNLGVSKGRNLLLASILQNVRSEDLIVFLDNDVEVLTGWYEPFVKLFLEKASAGIAGVTGHEILVNTEGRELLPSPPIGPALVDVVSGYCMWVRPSTAAALGPFDENLGLFWHEDDDYCVRAMGLGFAIYALPDATVLHHSHQSGIAGKADADEMSLLNQRYLAAKWREMNLVDARGRIVGAELKQQ